MQSSPSLQGGSCTTLWCFKQSSAMEVIGQHIQSGHRALCEHLDRFQQGLRQQQHPALGPRHLSEKRGPRLVRPAPFAAMIPGDSVGGAVLSTGLLNFLQLYNTALVVRLVLTWFPNNPTIDMVTQPLATITDPYLGLFRGIIPPIGGTLDLSPILAFVTLNFFTSAAAALPCEMNGQPEGRSARSQNAGFFGQFQTAAQKAWQHRVAAQKAARQQQA